CRLVIEAVQVLPDKEAEMFLMKLEQEARTDSNGHMNKRKKLIELFDHAISMNKYTLKDPTALGRDYIVEQFNLAFNMNITYGFFKNKLDEFKKSYKMWKFLMKSTGISVDPETSMIYASPEWWDNHEAGCRLTKSFNREPPKFWDIMLESILEEVNNVGDMGVVHTLVADEGLVCIDQVEAQELMLEVVHEEVGENNHLRQQCKKLLLGLEIFNDKVYNNFFLAEALFLDLQVTKHTKFYWKYLNTLQDTDEDKLKLLEAMTGVSRNNEDIPKQLGLGVSPGMGNTTKRTTLGHTAKCATMGHTAKSTTMGCTAWFSTRTVNCTTMGHTTNCTTVGHTTECSTMGHTTECSAMEHTAEYSAMRHTTEC
ncbi:unnamed protein product, partial [Brassica oleracea]